MGNYVNGILNDGERIIFETRLSLVVFFTGGVLATLCLIFCFWAFFKGGKDLAFAGLGAFGLGILILLYNYVIWKCSEFVVTNRRVITKTGFISRNAFEMRLEKIESINFRQSILGRLLKYGTLVITGTGDTAKSFKDIKFPLKFKRAAEEATNSRVRELGRA